MFRPTHGTSFAMAKTHLAMATMEIHGAIVVLIIGGICGYGEKGNSYYDCYSKVHTNNS